MTSGLATGLACPRCRGPVREERGAIRCERCPRDYPVVDGVPRMFSGGAMERDVRRTRERFAWEWERYPGSLDEDRPVFLEETQLPAEAWKGRRALDVGCGMGRYARVALGLGAEVTAFDLSDALLRLKDEAAREPRLRLVQGDVLEPPFTERAFDIVYSQGVLHHARDTEAAFRRVAALVRPGGWLTVWVYGRPGRYRDFATNPLRPGREWLAAIRPVLWLGLWARLLLSDGLRLFTTRMPAPLLYGLCLPLALAGAVPGLRLLTFSAHPGLRVRLHENFDWLAPPFQHKHTKEEVRAWFESEGFSDLRILPHGAVPKVGFAGRKA